VQNGNFSIECNKLENPLNIGIFAPILEKGRTNISP